MTTAYVNDIVATLTIVAMSCGECGLTFGLSREFIAARREDHRTFYCPNGHSRWYPQKNETEQLQDQLNEAARRLEASRSLARREAERRASAERSTRAYKGQVTKIKRRVGNGVCPCCTRSFADLAAHMTNKHPGYPEQS